MIRRSHIAVASVASLLTVAATLTFAKLQEPPAHQEIQLPPGWTMEDVTKAMAAAAPGEMHEFLAEAAGTWRGTSTMWYAPRVDPMQGEGVSTVTPIMGGRFVKVEYEGEWPGMGPYNGLGLFGYDNVSEKFQFVWIEDHSTTMMIGEGELSEDRKTLTWNFTYSCPITGKPAQGKQIERYTGEDGKTLEIHSACPKTGEVFKMMEVDFKRDPVKLPW